MNFPTCALAGPEGLFVRSSVMRRGDETRQRIVDAATIEFAAKGLAGGRVDRIARRARANKRMLYYYFGSKRGLFEEVLTAAIRRRMAAVPSGTESPVDVALAWYRHATEHPELVRLLLWQALEAPPSATRLDRDTKQSLSRLRAGISLAVGGGRLSPTLDVSVLLLALISLSVFPIGFPHITLGVTGHLPRDRRFQEMHAAMLQHLLGA